MSYFRALSITIFGIVLMSFESLLIKASGTNGLTFSFYVSIFLFFSTNFILFNKYKGDYFFVFKQDALMLVLCAIFFTASNLLFILSIKNTTVANASLIFASAPIFSAMYLYILFKVKSKKNVYISSFFIFIGLGIIFFSDLNSEGTLGNIYALICVLFYALSFTLLSKYKNIDVYALFALSGLLGAINSYILSDHIDITFDDLKLALFAGLLVVPISRVLVGKGTKTLQATEVSLLMVLETILAPLFVWIFLNEIPSDNTFIGGAIILITLIVNSLYLIKSTQKISH